MWVQIAIVVGAELLKYAYHRYIEDHPAPPRQADLQLPRVAEGTPIPLLYGTVRVRSPVMVWSGNAHVPGREYSWVASRNPHVDHSESGGARSENYSVDLLWILGVPFYRPVDLGDIFDHAAVTLQPKAWIGDTIPLLAIGEPVFAEDSLVQKVTVYDARITEGAIVPDSGAISLTGVLYLGSSIQDVTDGALSNGPIGQLAYWDVTRTGDTSFRAALLNASEDLTQIPGFRNQVVMYAHIGLGSSPSMPSFSFELTSLSTGTMADLGQSLIADADPAAVILDLLTSPWGKLSLPAESIERPSFARCSATLFAEGHGYSIVVDQGRDASDIIDEILKQIDGVMYPEPTTGKLVLRLIRADYDVATLRDINPSNARPADTSWFSIQSWSELPTQVRVTWTDRQNNYADAVAVGQNSSAAVAQGRTLRSVSIRYPGCCDAVLAYKLAARELAVASIPMVKVSLVVDRSFHRTRPGDVYTWTWPELGVERMVMRVARVNLGQLHDGKITLDMVRDAFDVTIGAFGSGSGSGSGSGGQHV